LVYVLRLHWVAPLAVCTLLIALVASVSGVAAGGGQRVVSLAPSVTETLFALGVGDEVVGVSQYCNYPKAVLRLPRVGTFLSPNVEAIAALRPTLVIAPSLSANQRQLRALEAMGCPIMLVSDDSVAEIRRTIARIGARVGRKEAARQLDAVIAAQIKAVKLRLAEVAPRSIVMLIGHEPMVAVGAGTFLDELLRIAHGRNIADATGQSWPQLSVEFIIASRPQVILDGQMGEEQARSTTFWDRYPEIPAVGRHRVYGYDADLILRPGPRIGQSLEVLALRIHPEQWKARAAVGEARSAF
jgi:iron complex transport system substrate-binding protein